MGSFIGNVFNCPGLTTLSFAGCFDCFKKKKHHHNHHKQPQTTQPVMISLPRITSNEESNELILINDPDYDFDLDLMNSVFIVMDDVQKIIGHSISPQCRVFDKLTHGSIITIITNQT